MSPPVAEARSFAAALGGSLIVLGVVEGAQQPDALREKLKAQFEGEADETRVRVGPPAEQLRNEQAENYYDLVVLGAAGRQAIRSASLRRLLREASTPLLFGVPRGSFERVHICTAVGEPGKSDVRIGGWIAGRMNARVTLLHVSRDAAEPPAWIRAHLDQGVATLSAFDVPAARARVRAGRRRSKASCSKRAKGTTTSSSSAATGRARAPSPRATTAGVPGGMSIFSGIIATPSLAAGR